MTEGGAPKLTGIMIYPLKGAGGIQLPRATMGPLGIPGDRRWMLVTPEGEFISQRTHPRLALLKLSPGPAPASRGPGDSLELSFRVEGPGLDSLTLDPSREGGERMPVRVHQDRFQGQRCSEEADGWFSGFLGEPCHLVRFPRDTIRPTDPAYAPGHQTAFTDGYPLHLASAESLRELNRRLGEPLEMARFRPNLVVDGHLPWEEDEWRVLEVGEVRVKLVKPCARCSVTLVQPEEATLGEEPLATLATFRRWEGKVFFGQNGVVLSGGRFATGAPLRILERGTRRPPLPALPYRDS